MTTTELRLKRKDVRIVTLRVVKQNVKDGYVKVMVKSLTMSAHTARVDSRMYPLVLNLVTQIVFGNPRGHN